MTSERSAAYGGLMTLIEQRVGSVLHADEAALLREGADAHLFSTGPGDESLTAIRAQVEALFQRLSGRGWPQETIDRIRAGLDGAAGWVPAAA